MTFLRTDSLTWRRQDIRNFSWRGKGEIGVLTFGMGTDWVMAASPRSSIMFLISMERSATLRSIVPSQSMRSLRGGGGCLTDYDLSAIIADEGDLVGFGSHCG